MKNYPNHSQNPTDLETISITNAAMAYDKWLEKKGRAERNSDVNSDRLFIKAIYALLDSAQDDAPNSLGVPTTRSGWANWRKNRRTNPKRIRLDVCRAIKVLTEIDITANKRLALEAINASDMVKLGPVRAVSKSHNDQEAEIVVDWIDFKVSTAKTVTKDVGKKNANSHDRNEVLGVVRYAIFEASVYIKGGDSLNPTPRKVSISASETTANESSVELTIDRESHLRWRAVPLDERDVLKGGLEGISLAKGRVNIGDEVNVLVSVAPNDINPIFQWQSSQHISNEQERRAREELVEQILRNRMTDNGPRQRFVLSCSPVVKI